MRKIFKNLLVPSKVVILLIIGAMVYNMLDIKFWHRHNQILYWDVVSYYAYLPAAFIYDDLTLDFVDNYEGDHEFIVWTGRAENGNRVIKTSMGLSYMYMPWFFIGHVVALNTDFDAGGYSIPYRIAMQFGVAFYLLIALFFFRSVLKRFFSEWVTALTILAIVVGTNMYYYSVFEATMSHSYSFLLFSIFLWLTMKWHDKPSWLNTIFVGLILGVITLIRPTNILISLVFILWGVDSWKAFKNRVAYFLKSYPKVLMMIFCFILVWIPQLVYWKVVTGDLFYYSYGGEEGFYFMHPHFLKGLFSWRKGWFLYTPLMAFAFVGFPLMLKRKNTKGAFLPISLYTFINMWVIFSWWCWWYGGGLGNRAFVESYVVLAIPLASLLSYLLTRKKLVVKIATVLVLACLITHSIYQTKQYYFGAIHWDSMTKESYIDSMGRFKPSEDFSKLIKKPDYKSAKKGLPEYENEEESSK